MRRGELYRVFKPSGDTKKFRVFVVVSRQVALDSNFSSAICAPVYSLGRGLLTQVPIGTVEGLKHESWIVCDDLYSIPKSALTDFVGSLSRAKLADLNRALKMALDLE